MEATYLQWNVVNWITVVLMVTIGMLFVGAVASGLRVANGGTVDGGDDD